MKIKGFNNRDIERYILGELPVKKMMEFEVHLNRDLQWRKEVANRKKRSFELLQKYPPSNMVEDIYNQLIREKLKLNLKNHQKKSLKSKWLLASPAFILVAILLSLNLHLFKRNQGIIKTQKEQQITRKKGMNDGLTPEPYLNIYRERKGKIEVMENGGQARPGDILQLVYMSGTYSHGVIISIDGNGEITLHFPGKSGSSTLLERKKKVQLPTAFQLDHAPHYEKFFFFASNGKIDVAKLLKHVKDNLQMFSGNDINQLSYEQKLYLYTITIKKGG
jgi:hypothetical protein